LAVAQNGLNEAAAELRKAELLAEKESAGQPQLIAGSAGVAAFDDLGEKTLLPGWRLAEKRSCSLKAILQAGL
jgi:hypothetical protein